jgi:23S rRNA (cytosine1962-C5)-methyltransferase
VSLPSDLASLANRLRKSARHLARWARREGLAAYRLYDRDIPEYPYAIDRYDDWLHVQLFEGRRELDDAAIAQHLAAIGDALAVPRAQVVLKRRARQRGRVQYEKLADDAPGFVVSERGLRFEVNLNRYLDTGLFLDHRDTRRMVGAEARGRRMLNLFAYTGSFTVYAAAGGARETLSVDLSHTYHDWLRRNLRLNGLDDPGRHRQIAADVDRYLAEARAAGERFDLIVLDPPSFSNSKRMRTSFDVQRDHALLLARTLALLAPGGTLWFSTNRQGFALAPELAADPRWEEITARTVPPDFRRRLPHRCWRVRSADPP